MHVDISMNTHMKWHEFIGYDDNERRIMVVIVKMIKRKIRITDRINEERYYS